MSTVTAAEGAVLVDDELAAGSGAADPSDDVVDIAMANQASHVDDGDLSYDRSNAVEINLNGTNASVDSDSDAVGVDGGVITITDDGTYIVGGTLDNGQIIVDAGDGDDVTLVLAGVDITNTSGAAIAIMNADEAVVLLADRSNNRLTDGATYLFPDAETDEPNAALYSAVDLAIAGDGELAVTANYNDGIAGKDGLVIAAGSVTVTAADDGVRGKDYVIVQGGTIAIDAAGDGIKADNDEDPERGYVLVSDGDLDITAGDDGIQAATDLLVSGGTISIDAGLTSGTGRALQGDVTVAVSDGDVTAHAVDDAVHSNNAVTINGGSLTLSAGDDGIHGDYLVTINGGSITITDSFEGIEAEVIEINDGVIDVTSNDDGLNVARADAATAEAAAPPDPRPDALPDTPLDVESVAPTGGRGERRGPGGGPDRGPVEMVGEHYVYINGGSISITVTGALAEQGDGIDANGHIVMTGGVVSISGATDTRNSALDYSGGSFEMTGGLLIGTNIDGRNSEGVGAGSSQASLYITTGSVVGAGTVVHIESTDGDSLVTFQPANDYSVIVFSSPDLVAGQTYELYLGGTVSGDSTSGIYDAADAVGELVGTATANQ